MFYGFESDNHLFKKDLQARAISRDVDFFSYPDEGSD